MFHHARTLALVLAPVLAVCLGPAAARSGQAGAEQTYDLLFRTGTLDGIDGAGALVYERDVVSALSPEAAERDSGTVVLKLGDGVEDMARLELRQGDRHRGLGVFPASVGNPMIMYFYESAVRDMAEAAGGSPFYIRNRVKDALIRPSEMETGEAVFDGRTVPTTTIALRPFAEDPNRDRMKGFGDLVLSVTMSEEVPGWYLSLVAEATGADGPVYRSSLTLDGVEAAQ